MNILNIRNKESTRRGYDTLDILKLILAFIVLLRHVGQIFFDDHSAFRAVMTNTISPIAVPVFLLSPDSCFSGNQLMGAD